MQQPGDVVTRDVPRQRLWPDGADDDLGDGVSEEMIAQLGALVPDRLGVIARTSAMQYKNAGKSAAAIGRELGVEYLGRVAAVANLQGVARQPIAA